MKKSFKNLGKVFAGFISAALLLQGCAQPPGNNTPPPATQTAARIPVSQTQQTQQTKKPAPEDLINSSNITMKLTSPAFEDNGLIPSKYTCDAESMSPPLQIVGVPVESKSLALVVHDPDAQVAGGFTHWVVWNIAPQTSTINENTVPQDAVQGKGGSGKNAWVAPCPPSGGVHHYQFMLYALDSMLDIPADTDKAGLEQAMSAHSLGQTTLVGLYQKK